MEVMFEAPYKIVIFIRLMYTKLDSELDLHLCNNSLVHVMPRKKMVKRGLIAVKVLQIKV